MEGQALNPFLPSYEYIADGEPYVFGERVYVYGSHDKFNGILFCLNEYVCWSAPVDNLADWRYEGVIYKKKQDPRNKWRMRCCYAPDVAKGADGKYYLYYALDFMGVMSVAVCDTPAGEFRFLGHVRFPDGHVWGSRRGEPFPFDPGVLVDEDGRVYLYSGFAVKIPLIATGFHSLTNEGGVVLELESDMVTIKSGPQLLFPAKGHPGAFEGHAFFEASSIRKEGDNYYFVYSSEHNHELCYALGKSPKGPFTFGGTLVDLGDLFLNSKGDERGAVNYLGNTHGGLVEIGDQWYIFYHRQTNRHSYSRQACAEPLERRPEGGFLQAEVTSCGLGNSLLKGRGRYEARIACNLWSKTGAARYDMGFPRLRLSKHPYFTQSGRDREEKGDQYIANLRDGAVAGFKYFALRGLSAISVELRGKARGEVLVSQSWDFSKTAARFPVRLDSRSFIQFQTPCFIPDGKRALYFKFEGRGYVDFKGFTLIV